MSKIIQMQHRSNMSKYYKKNNQARTFNNERENNLQHSRLETT